MDVFGALMMDFAQLSTLPFKISPRHFPLPARKIAHRRDFLLVGFRELLCAVVEPEEYAKPGFRTSDNICVAVDVATIIGVIGVFS